MEGHVLKRSVDFALAGLLLAVSIPFLAFAAILIKLDSQGPVIFRQTRMGRGFRRFQLLKLRSMVAEAAGPSITLGADPRITHVGRWLRRFKLDELPQLWNVLCGDMSLVGPRPVIPELTVEFNREYCRLLEVRPGLTDPATLKYRCEEQILALVPDPLEYFKTVVTPDKLRISQEYLWRAGVWSDLGVMAQTVVALLAPRWQPQCGSATFVPLRRSPALLFCSQSARGMKVQPVSEPISMAGPVELFTLFEESSDVYGLPEANRLGYRHRRSKTTPAERNR
jgi:lipopolysaccharide/colanic/teichoic acid biosynthesis glycosyltransferase